MGKPSIQDVEEHTKKFLERHGIQLKDGWKRYNFTGAILNGDKPGCYALLNKDDEVIYIGLGASLGAGKYEGHGIAARLTNHVLRWDKNNSVSISERKYVLRDNWLEVGSIYTFGLKDFGYMACALEAYLINEIKPLRNFNLKKLKPIP